MITFFKNKKEISVYSPLDGTIKNLEQINDSLFSKKVIGDGIAIDPLNSIDKIYSPLDKAQNIYSQNNNHAFKLKINNNILLLIHIGIDTINLNDNGIKTFLQNKKWIYKNDILAEVDFSYLKKQNLPGVEIIIILIKNNEIYNYNCNLFDVAKAGTKIKKGELLFRIKIN